MRIFSFPIISALIYLFLGVFNSDLKAQSVQEIILAEHSYSNQNWEESNNKYQKLVIDNPYNGEYWYRLAWINHQLSKFEKAKESYLKAIEAGYQLSTSSYNLACLYSLTNSPDSAVQWLSFSFKNGLQGRERLINTDSELDPIRHYPAFKKLLSAVDHDIVKSRTVSWSEDIQFLKTRFETTHYNLFSLIDRPSWDNKFDHLTSNIDLLEDYEIVVKLMQIVASIEAGHSYVIPPFSGEYQFHQLPIQLSEFDDGIYIKQVDENNADIVGYELLSINGHKLSSVIDSVQKVANPENAIMKRSTSLFYLTLTEVLAAYDLANELDSIKLTLRKKDGVIIEKTLKSVPFSPEIVSTRSTLNGWVSMNDKSTFPLPLYLKYPKKAHWFEYVPETGILYAQLNEIRNSETATLKEFGEQLKLISSNNNVSAIILDLRFNNGGNGLLNKDFLLELLEIEQVKTPGQFFTIIGNRTFSAAMLLATQLDQYTETIFIGEPTGGKPSHIGDDNHFVLPNSGLMSSASQTYWQSPVSYDNREWIAPKIYISMTSEHYLNNVDPVIKYLENFFKKD
tara:strand:- start:5776 stop:7476 length:1701 start_codon:yes stop_codon:yes gene_type:complete